jgi:hypothetical protein
LRAVTDCEVLSPDFDPQLRWEGRETMKRGHMGVILIKILKEMKRAANLALVCFMNT